MEQNKCTRGTAELFKNCVKLTLCIIFLLIQPFLRDLQHPRQWDVTTLIIFSPVLRFLLLIDQCPGQLVDTASFSADRFMQRGGFLARLFETGEREKFLMSLYCFPLHLRTSAREDAYLAFKGMNVSFLGEETSRKPMSKADEIFVSLPDAIALDPSDQRETKLKYVS